MDGEAVHETTKWETLLFGAYEMSFVWTFAWGLIFGGCIYDDYNEI